MKSLWRNKDWCTVKNVEGQQLLFMPDGQVVPALIESITIDGVGSPAKAVIVMFVNIGDDDTERK